MSQARYEAGGSGQYTGTLQTADGTAVVYDAGGTATPRISTLTLTLKDAASTSVVNSRNAQDVLNANNVTVDSAGALKWLIQPGDTALLDSSRAVEEHLARFTFAYVDTDLLTKTGVFEHSLVCRAWTPLCSFDDLTAQLGGLDASERLFVEGLIDAFAERAERETSRKFATQTVTEYFDVEPGQSSIRLSHYPISSVTGVWEDPDGEFDASIDLIPADDYDIRGMGSRGVLRMRFRPFLPGEGVLKVTYTGGVGYMTEGVGGVPSDLRNAAVRQVAYWYQRRASLGVTGESVGGASVSIMAAQDLLEDVRRVLGNYRPVSLI